jgi:hypothetical protein
MTDTFEQLAVFVHLRLVSYHSSLVIPITTRRHLHISQAAVSNIASIIAPLVILHQ